MKAKTSKPLETEYPTPPFQKEGIQPPGLEAEMKEEPHYRGASYVAAGKLRNKVAIITGGDSGIGRSTAYLYAREEAKVCIACLPEEKKDAESIVEEIDEIGGRATYITGDISNFEFANKIVSHCLESFGQIDILVNNAAYQKHISKIEDLSFEQWDKTFRTNIYGYFYMVKAALRYLKQGSVIINVGSITGLEGSKALLDYSATKGAIHAFTKSLAGHLVDRGIRVNCVAPGPVWTPLNPAERKYEDYKDFGDDVPYERPAQPEEISPLLVYLASNADSNYMTGEVITLLGGQTRAA